MKLSRNKRRLLNGIDPANPPRTVITYDGLDPMYWQRRATPPSQRLMAERGHDHTGGREQARRLRQRNSRQVAP